MSHHMLNKQLAESEKIWSGQGYLWGTASALLSTEIYTTLRAVFAEPLQFLISKFVSFIAF